MEEYLKYFKVAEMVSIITQFKVAPGYIYKNYFEKSKKSKMSPDTQIPIYKGSGVILSAASEDGKHMVQDQGKKFLINLTIPRFPLKDTIPASELNSFASLEDKKEQLVTLSQRIGELVGEHKESFLTTLEYMSVGALFGKVIDGKGKTLFEFKSDTPAITVKSGVKTIEALNQVEEKLEEELGFIPPYDILASRSFINGLAILADEEKLFDKGTASWVEENGRRIFVIHGKKFIPYSATYKNTKGETKKFIEDNKAIVIPSTNKVYKLYYSRANHTKALKLPPKLFFSAPPEELEVGAGWVIASEMRAIPICIRPGALIELTYTAS